MKGLVTCIALLPAFGLATGSFAASLSADWPTSTPPSATDAWQFYAGLDPASPDVNSATRLSFYGPLSSFTGVNMWAPGPGAFPFVAKNMSGTPITVASGTLPADAVYAHPPDFGSVGIAYHVPESGLYDLSGYVQRLDSGDVDWLLNVNGASSLSGNTLGLKANESTPLSLTHVSLSAGDFVYLILDANGSFGGDSTGVGLTITKKGGLSVPDGGSTMVLLFGTVAGIGCTGFRNRKKAEQLS